MCGMVRLESAYQYFGMQGARNKIRSQCGFCRFNLSTATKINGNSPTRNIFMEDVYSNRFHVNPLNLFPTITWKL